MLPRGTLLTVTLALAAIALLGIAGQAHADSTEPRDRIYINGDDDAHANTCECIANPHADGTSSDPYLIQNWRIEEDEGTGIDIRNLDTVHIIVRNNAIEAPNGIHLHDTGTRVDLYNNNIYYDQGQFGIDLKDASPHVQENVIRGWSGFCGCPRGAGISADGSAPVIEENVISESLRGIHANAATPQILDNELFENKHGIVLENSAQAEIAGNLVRLSIQWGITVGSSSQATVMDNDIRQGHGGVLAERANKLTLTGNTLTNIDGDAVTFEKTHVEMTNNEISHNWRGAVGAQTSDLLIQDNLFTNNGDDAITLRDTSGTLHANTLTKNEGTAIALEKSIMEITDNNLANNTFGFSIPYESKQTIERMSGNIVNGINVDGTLDPSEQRLFYKAVNVQVEGETIDSGHSDGYYGVITKQGALVLYDITGATIKDNVFANQTTPDPSDGDGRAVYIVNSFNVNILDNVFENNHEGILAIDARTFVKDNVCRIDIDPPQTICIEARGGYMDAEDNTVRFVDIGIRYGVSHGFEGHVAEGTIVNNLVEGTTSTGIHLAGEWSSHPMDKVHVEANTLQDGEDGILASHMLGTIQGNDVTNNNGDGIIVTQRTDATLNANTITANQNGVIDTGNCSPNYTVKCSSGTFHDNLIQDNQNVGVRMLDGATFHQDTIQANTLGLDLLATNHLDDVTLTENGLAVQAQGHLTITDTNIHDNGEGLEHKGTLTLDATTISDNDGPAITANGDVTTHGSTLDGNNANAATIHGTLKATDTTASNNDGTGIHVNGDATIETTTANGNAGDGIHVEGSATLDETTTDNNEDAGIRLHGDTFTITDCHTRSNEHGILVEPHAVNLDQDLFLAHLTPFDAFKSNTPTDVRIDGCHLTDNQAFAIEAATDALVEAQRNYWGDDGPIYNIPFHRTPNTVSNHVIVTPYWEDEDQTQPGFVPKTELHPTLLTTSPLTPFLSD